MHDTVPESQLSVEHPSCPVCESTQPREREVKLQTEPTVWMSRCPDCHASSADRFPTPEFLKELYNPVHYSSPLTADSTLAARCAARILESFTPDPDARVELVDYGGNRGTLARQIREQLLARGHRGEVNGTVVDLFPGEPVDNVRFIDLDEFAADDRRYDLVLASAVLEHLTDLREVLTRLLAAAKPGALFYARTPFDVPLARVSRSRGYKVRWPRHLFDMGPEFWNRFLTTIGASGELLVSRPSVVETSLRSAPLRTIAAHILKAPANIESRVFGRRVPFWRLIGGWEVLIRLDG